MIKVLVIEDEVTILENISDYLSMNDFQVYTATNGNDGFKLALSVNPDIIISDIMMPGMNGLELLKSLRNDNNTAEIPLIFLTAKSEDNDLRMAMNLGADDYVKKPFRNSDLMASINTRLKKVKVAQERSKKQLDEIRYSLTVSLPHELYTPLNGIMGYSQLLKNDIHSYSKEDLDDILDHLYTSAQRLNKIISNYVYYLSLLEIINSGIKLEGEFSLNATEIISEHSNVAARKYFKSNNLVFHLQAESLKISGTHLFKLVYELVDNACKFSYENTPITIRGYTKDDYYYLSIHNFGIGMTQEHIKNIGAYIQFNRDKFEQQGLGLGLAVSKKICEIYNLKIDFFSIPDSSFEVTVRFPVYHNKW